MIATTPRTTARIGVPDVAPDGALGVQYHSITELHDLRMLDRVLKDALQDA